MNYSDSDIRRIESEILAKQARDQGAGFSIDGKLVANDWAEDTFISDNLYEDYLRAVQQGRVEKASGKQYTADTTFEEYLTDCLKTLEFRKIELSLDQTKGRIDTPTYNAAKEVAERAETAIKHYLEKSSRARLIGV